MSFEQRTRFSEIADPANAPHIAILASPNALFEGLVRILEKHVAGSRVVLADRLTPSAEIGQSVGLVLVHASVPLSIVECVTACRAAFPRAALAIISEDVSADIARFNHLFVQRRVQGLLPLSFKLDVWLAAVSLLLSGGEYYPYLHAKSEPDAAQAPAEPAQEAAHPRTQAADADLEKSAFVEDKGLTRREVEILQLVSEGHQNKHIAHEMALSEHTVKVHVHNLITKLRVNNRTQAAAAFRTGRMPASATMTGPSSGLSSSWTLDHR
jgi:DNA-binding NarL/FixJ family response regulator